MLRSYGLGVKDLNLEENYDSVMELINELLAPGLLKSTSGYKN